MKAYPNEVDSLLLKWFNEIELEDDEVIESFIGTFLTTECFSFKIDVNCKRCLK